MLKSGVIPGAAVIRPSRTSIENDQLLSIPPLYQERDEQSADYQSKTKITGPSGDTTDLQLVFSINSLLITPM